MKAELKLSAAWDARSKLWAEGDKLWAEGVLEAYGNITLEWRRNADAKSYDCILENGEHYVAAASVEESAA